MRSFESGGGSNFEVSNETQVERNRGTWQKMGQKVLDVVKAATEKWEERRFQKRVELVQMRAEESYNDRLDAVEYLDEALRSQEEGVTKTVEEYEGQQVDVYSLTGLPFHFLQHSLEGLSKLGVADELRKNPALWMKNGDEVPLEDAGQYGDTLSVSYIDTDVNLARGGVAGKHGLTYGFSRIRPGTLLQTNSQDGRTPNRTKYVKTNPGKMMVPPDKLARRSTHYHNEVLLRRYDEDGAPMKPDFLVARDETITDDMKRHAAYFGVPIVSIETAPYLERQKESLTTKIEQIDENSDYDEIAEMFIEAEESSLDIDSTWKENIHDDHRGKIDLYYQEKFTKLPEEAREKLREVIERIEPAKRMEVLDGKLREMISGAQQTKNGRKDDLAKSVILERVDGSKPEEVDGEEVLRMVDALKISYKYTAPNGEVRWIRTLLQEPTAAYEYFSGLADEYERGGGVVRDSRWRRDEGGKT